MYYDAVTEKGNIYVNNEKDAVQSKIDGNKML